MARVQVRLLQKLLLSASRCILFHWIKPRPPTIKLWFGVLPMKFLKGNESAYDKIWAPSRDYSLHHVCVLALRWQSTVNWCPTCSLFTADKNIWSEWTLHQRHSIIISEVLKHINTYLSHLHLWVRDVVTMRKRNRLIKEEILTSTKLCWRQSTDGH